MSHHELIPQLFKTEYRKIIAVLCKLFGAVNMDVAEDLTNDTFLLATETWGLKGLPENPKAWLYSVAKNKTRDYLRRHKTFTEKVLLDYQHNVTNVDDFNLDFSAENIKDSQLQMMFVLCHPSLAIEAQVAMILRTLCGFGIEEIAEAFLTQKDTINKRLHRAKQKLRTEDISIEMPSPKEASRRLDSVLKAIYLLFNEGYYSSTQNHGLRKELCLEAIRLNYLLLENQATQGNDAYALMALMCFHSSRFEARTGSDGALVLYEDQNTEKWNLELIEQGEYYLNQSASGNTLSNYHLEAAIAFWHTKPDGLEGKWENILQLYNRLLQLYYSPITALNRTYALARARSKAQALDEALKIDLKQNHLYHSLLAELYLEIDNELRLYHLKRALELAKTENDKKLLAHKIKTSS